MGDRNSITPTAQTGITIGKNKYIVKSICLGNNGKSFQQALLDLAEKKALREMGLA